MKPPEAPRPAEGTFPYRDHRTVAEVDAARAREFRRFGLKAA